MTGFHVWLLALVLGNGIAWLGPHGGAIDPPWRERASFSAIFSGLMLAIVLLAQT